MENDWADVNEFLSNQQKTNDAIGSITSMLSLFYNQLVEKDMPEELASELTQEYMMFLFDLMLMVENAKKTL